MLKKLNGNGGIEGVTDEDEKRQKLQDVLDIINFVNLLAHVVRSHYVEPQPVLRRHTPIIRDCQTYVIETKWLKAYRDTQKDRLLFLNFAILCDPKIGAYCGKGR